MHDGDDASFAAFVRAEGPALLRLAAGLTGDVGGAEDLVQTALAKADSKWGRVQSADVPTLYVRRILINAATSGWRARSSRPPEILSSQLPEVATDSAGYDGIVHRDALRRAMTGLGGRQRAVLVLRYLEDRPDDDIATLLGCSSATVRSQAARGLAQLRKHPDLIATNSGSLR